MKGVRRLVPVLVLAAAAFGALALAGVLRPGAARGDSTTPAHSITVNGHGSITVVPDQAVITAGVRTSAASAQAALASNAAAMNGVIAALKKIGFKSLQTQEVSLSPQTNANGRVTGYVAQDSVSVTAAVGDAGRLIDAAVAAGANTIDGPTLGVSIQNQLYRTALGRAVADARLRAKAIARAGGFHVGRVLSVTEESTPTPIVFGAAPAAKAPTPVVPGTQNVTADVQVSFAIR